MLLIVNTASACGFTPQFGGLEELHKTYGTQGPGRAGLSLQPVRRAGPGQQRGDRAVLPAQLRRELSDDGQDRRQRPGAPIRSTSGSRAEAPGLLGSKAIKWNFTKFLVGKDGQVIKRYAPADAPASLAKDIEKALGKS